MTKQHFEDYLLVLDSKMEHCGFVKFHQEPHDLQAERSFRRRKFSITKFGVVDTFCVVKFVAENLTTNFLESFSKQVFEFALKNKIWLPRGWGGTAVAYSLLVTDIASDDVHSFVKKYCPKHWASFEFPTVVELSSKSVLCYDSTPVWGAAYYRGFRKEAESLFRIE